MIKIPDTKHTRSEGYWLSYITGIDLMTKSEKAELARQLKCEKKGRCTGICNNLENDL